MKKMGLLFWSLISVVWLSGCGNQVFVKKPKQTQKQYRSDMIYCKGEALGTWQDQSGISAMQVRAKTNAPLSYDDCMRQMGYQQAH